MKKYKVDWSKTYIASGTVEIEAESEEDAEIIAEENIGDYEGSMQYDPNENYVEVVGEVKSITTQMAEDLLKLEIAEDLLGMRFPRDFDGAHHVNNEQERLDKFNKANKADKLQDLM